ncbi:Uncharacterised protein [Legionella pneumophila]|nr:Uncharacterised protein [Legionella pneumophila]
MSGHSIGFSCSSFFRNYCWCYWWSSRRVYQRLSAWSEWTSCGTCSNSHYLCRNIRQLGSFFVSWGDCWNIAINCRFSARWNYCLLFSLLGNQRHAHGNRYHYYFKTNSSLIRARRHTTSIEYVGW